ncbi:hypothetical protein SAMN05518866_12049 [Sphingobium sp. YR768]|nr:hypothetical protein SAMN05518866_12049 [Sphingobium sp. YR768]
MNDAVAKLPKIFGRNSRKGTHIEQAAHIAVREIDLAVIKGKRVEQYRAEVRHLAARQAHHNIAPFSAFPDHTRTHHVDQAFPSSPNKGEYDRRRQVLGREFAVCGFVVGYRVAPHAQPVDIGVSE